jgi:tryptophan halogenase
VNDAHTSTSKSGRVFRARADLFQENSRTQAMPGQGILPEQYHPVCDVMTCGELTRCLSDIKNRV